MRRPDQIAEAGAWLLEHGHRALLALTGGRYPRTVMGMLTVELHTVGRKSGRPYANLLTSPVHDDQRIVLVASKGGHTDHPDWYKNLRVDPEVRVQVKADRFAARARTATGEERERLWRIMAAVFPTYDEYRRRTEREIPVVVLEPKR